MKTVIVYNHPYEKSFCHAILEAAQKGAQQAGHEVDIIDLDKDKFNPVMTGEDLRGFVKHTMVDEMSIDYFNRIKTADNLILIFPIWWEVMPAMMKGFIDKVFFPGSFYGYTESGKGMQTFFPNMKITIITTMNTPAPVYRFIFGNAIKNALIKGTFRKTGFKNVKWISFNMVKGSTDQKRKDWLKKVEESIK